jgi:hypothetical protein
MGTLTTKITENFTGLNGLEKTTTTLSLTDIDLVDKRIMMATLTERPLASFASFAQAGGYVREDVRYLRITNQDATNFIWLIFKSSSNDRFALKLDAGQSFYLNGDNATGLSAFFDANQAAEIVVAQAQDVADIRFLADTAPCQIELYVASV